ncbi:MAG: methionine gamma-lyase family protein [Clostridiales Family XIII bacterium]|jgi:cystathionine beta-lyase family protein involved in aluminum resistance|nr:methionine gamma-lyase family protein [Clostridiales Family XIII bacterium]
MNDVTRELLRERFGIDGQTVDMAEKAEAESLGMFARLDEIAAFNQYKILSAFQKNHVNDSHFAWNTGYGYGDPGRDVISKVYADTFGAPASLVRPIIVNGTHALSLALAGVLRPGDELLYCSGSPYDTLHEVIGIRGEGMGSLADFGISYKQTELTAEGRIDYEAVRKAISPKTRMVCLQRATGYAWRRALTIGEIKEWATFVKGVRSEIICMVDNCYGEFLDVTEPTESGVDIMAGSLIKNPGGGLALTGGYVAGRRDLIDAVSYRMTCPGIGDECGLTFGQTRSILQGLFIAPKTVSGAVKGAILCAKVFENLGYEVCPGSGDERSDIIEGVRLGSPEAVTAFCEGVQAAAPVDSYVKPVAWDMPGYEDQVIMAAGAFVQGSSIELSADGPIRPPYNVYFQGGLTYEHSKFGVMKALQTLKDCGLLCSCQKCSRAF